MIALTRGLQSLSKAIILQIVHNNWKTVQGRMQVSIIY